jgi:hypothetical protein
MAGALVIVVPCLDPYGHIGPLAIIADLTG